MIQNINILKEWVEKSNHIVFFGGAGVSTESGIPDFRSVDGLYHERYPYPPETILSHSFFLKHTNDFYQFYREKMIYAGAQPNITHKKLALWEAAGKLEGVITQNIDGLHQKAGSKTVVELHGSVLRNYCMKCNRFYTEEDVDAKEGIPHCDCGGVIKPDVVLYEEALEERAISDAIRMIRRADLFIVGGTSLSVYPAAGLIDYYKGDNLVLINKSETSYDSRADLIFHESLGDIFSVI